MKSHERFAAATIAALTAGLAQVPAAFAWPAETTRELAMREGPSMEYPHIRVIEPGTVVDVHHCNDSGSWCKVSAGATTGFLRGQYLQRLADVPPPPRVYYGAPPPPPPYYERPYRRYNGPYGRY